MKHTTRNPLARGDRDRYVRRSNTFLGKEVSLVLKVKFRPFKEAREYTNYLNLKLAGSQNIVSLALNLGV
jgi:hypothetical protein